MRIDTYNFIYTAVVVIGVIALFIRFPLVMSYILISIFLLILGIKIIDKLKFKYSLYKKGYGVKKCKYNSFYYVENIKGIQKEMKIECEQIEPGCSEIKLLPPADWDTKAPLWAKEKRKQIISNIQQIFKGKHFYVFPE